MRLQRRVLWVVILGLFAAPFFAVSVPALWAETEYHRQDANGNVTVEVTRTPGEQQMAEHAYDMGNGTTGYFLDSFNQKGGAVSKETYEHQVHVIGQTVIDGNERILGEARANASDEEYLALHSQINVINGNIRSQESSIKQTLAQAKQIHDTESTPNRTIKVVPKENQKSRVLVS